MQFVMPITYILGVAALMYALYWLGSSVVRTILGLAAVWEAAGERIGNALELEPPGLGELRADLVALERRLNDIEDNTETRYRKLSARFRRSIEPDEPPAADELPLQGAFPGLHAVQPGNGATVPLMRPPPKRR